MCDNCKLLQDKLSRQTDVLQQLIAGMEIMTINARVLTQGTMADPVPTKETVNNE